MLRTRVFRLVGIVMRVAAVALVIAVPAQLTGFVRLAEFLALGALDSQYAAVFIYAAVQILDGLTAFALRSSRTNLLGMVRKHRALLERRLRGLWPPGTNALGTAAALFCESIVTGSRRIVSAFVSLDRDNGTRAPVCAWPVSIGASGLERSTTPALLKTTSASGAR